MTVIAARLTVNPDGTVSVATPLPAGEYVARITVDDQPARELPTHPFDDEPLPTFDLGRWPEGLGLRREDMYGDDGR